MQLSQQRVLQRFRCLPKSLSSFRHPALVKVLTIGLLYIDAGRSDFKRDSSNFELHLLLNFLEGSDITSVLRVTAKDFLSDLDTG